MNNNNNFIESPLNYTGSKFKLLNQILPHFDYSKNIFCDLMAGGGSVFINVLDKYKRVVVNDKIKSLVGIYYELIYNDDFIKTVKKISPNKDDQERFVQIRREFNEKPASDLLWALLSSSTNNMMRFNKSLKYNQTFGRRSFNDNTLRKALLFKEQLIKYQDKLRFSRTDFTNIVINNSFYYIDPPYSYYSNDDGTIGKTQISQAGYNAYWSKTKDKELLEFILNLKNINSTFCLSGILEKEGKRCWLLDQLIKKGYECIDINCDYNKVSRAGDKNIREVLIKG